MNAIQEEANKKISEASQRVYRILIDKLAVSGFRDPSERSLTEQQSDLLAQLAKYPKLYKTLHGLFTCEMMINQVFEIQDKAQKVVLNCYQNMTHLLQNFALMAKVLQQHDRTLLCRAFTYSYQHLSSMLNELHSYPISNKYVAKKSSFVDQHLSILEEARQERSQQSETQNNFQDIEQQILQIREQNEGLKQSNQILRDSLTNAENQMVQLELKLVSFLNQREEVRNEDSNEVELREDNIKLRMEIERMNEEFRIQINKYNEVFRNMEREIMELKSMNVQADLVEELETEIIRLREEVESDKMIIQELREKEYNSSSRDRYMSPRLNGNLRYKPYN